MQAVTVACVVGTIFSGPLRAEPAASGAVPLRPPIAERVRNDVAIIPVPPRPLPPAIHPYPETADVGKETAGEWTCTGAVDKVTIKLALDDAWIQWTIVGGAGTTIQYRTYDGIAKQWTMLELTSSGKSRTLTTLGMTSSSDETWTWMQGDHRELELFMYGKKSSHDRLALSGERKH